MKFIDVLIVDDEADICLLLKDILEDEGFRVRHAQNMEDALIEMQKSAPQLVLLDIWLGDSRHGGLQILESIRKDFPDLPIIMMSGHGTIETAVLSIKKGANDFIEKPFQADHFLHIIRKTLENSRLKNENKFLKSQLPTLDEWIGPSIASQGILEVIQKVGPTQSRILIQGPPGTGKSFIARLLHQQFNPDHPFIVLNCATLTEQNFPRIFYGEKASISDPSQIGVFEKAHQGTLVLDDVGALPPPAQGALINFLQTPTFMRNGSTQKIETEVRIISIHSSSLMEKIKENNFSADLFYRLNVIPIETKPLSMRREDITPLAQHFLKKICALYRLPLRPLSPEVIATLESYNWPGNLHQLYNAIEYTLLMSAARQTHNEIIIDELPPEILGLTHTTNYSIANFINFPIKEAREAFEQFYLFTQIERFSGNISKTADFIGMERSALHRKLRFFKTKYGNKFPEAS